MVGVVERRHNWLLNPGIPIPEEARAVHGISDADVKDASLKAPPSTKGIVIDKKLFSRAIKDKKGKANEKEVLDRIDRRFRLLTGGTTTPLIVVPTRAALGSKKGILTKLSVKGAAVSKSARLGATKDLPQEPRSLIQSVGFQVTPIFGLKVPPKSL